MVCVDFIDQKVYSEAEGLFVSDLDLGIKGLIRARYPFALDSDFISYGNLSHYCMNYLDEIVQRANQKNEKIKYNVTTLMKEEEKPFNVEERLNKQATIGQRIAADYDRLQARNDFNVNKTSELEIRLLHEKIDHMVQQDQFELLEIQKLQTEMLVSLGNQLAQLKQLQK
ncbi:TPA: cyclic nucleotide-binding protein [Streptococcus agalactiae]